MSENAEHTIQGIGELHGQLIGPETRRGATSGSSGGGDGGDSGDGSDPANGGSEKGRKKCTDGIDNDGDGLIDAADPDC